MNATTPEQRQVQAQMTHGYQKSSCICHFQEVGQRLRELEKASSVESSNCAVKNMSCIAVLILQMNHDCTVSL